MNQDQQTNQRNRCPKFKIQISLTHIALIICLGFWAFHNNYDHAYNLDDNYGLKDNHYVRSLRHIPQYFVDPMTLTSYQSNADYRPVLQVTYALNYWVSQYDTWSWHLLQILLHIVVAISLYIFCIQMQFSGRRDVPMRWFWYAPLWIGVFGILHPTASGVVNYFWARSSLLVAAFVLPAMSLYLHRRFQKRFPVGALILYGLALFSKVEAVAALFVFVLIETYIYRRDSIDMRIGFLSNFGTTLSRLHKTPMPYFVALTCFYFAIRWSVLPEYAEAMRHDADVNSLVYFYTQLTAWWFYVWKWFVPLDLVADNMAYPIFRSLFSNEVLLAAGGWIIAGALILKLWRLRPELAFFAVAALAYLSPTSSIAPLSEMVNEHRPYLPLRCASVVWITLIFESLQGKGRDRQLMLKAFAGLGFVLVAASFSKLTVARNLVYKTNRSYAEDIVEKAPSARAYLNYGLTFLKDGEYERARELFIKSVNLAPNWFIAHINLGIVEDVLGFEDLAMKHFNRAVELERNTTLALKYRAAAWEKRSEMERYLADLRAAVDAAPYDCEAISSLEKGLVRAERSTTEIQNLLGKCN